MFEYGEVHSITEFGHIPDQLQAGFGTKTGFPESYASARWLLRIPIHDKASQIQVD